MTPIDRTTRMSGLRTALVWAVVTTAAASIGTTAYLAWEGLDQAATAVAASGTAAVSIGGAWAYARSREVATATVAHGSDGGDRPVDPNGGNSA
ncbi:hypothetical protein R2B67_00165 [Streptomyces cyaneofuscatus]|uniref:hypothetical protein n=1 Tax=Streptomyces cyaneofuscatus TaxID=66883 RepID=UPI002953BB91|nr:hypothetical protein [Streptomyces cyaneofuscatus]WOP07044.1 hypothetical protein R2B67_00165 [Streptomyces cyaneofuscatus]